MEIERETKEKEAKEKAEKEAEKERAKAKKRKVWAKANNRERPMGTELPNRRRTASWAPNNRMGMLGMGHVNDKQLQL